MGNTIEDLLKNLKAAGKSGLDEFAKGVTEAAKESARGILQGVGQDAAQRYVRTTLDMSRLMAQELLSGAHQSAEWLHIHSQQASQNLQSAAILQAQSLAFLANIVSIAGSVLGGFAGKVGSEIIGTLDSLVLKIAVK